MKIFIAWAMAFVVFFVSFLPAQIVGKMLVGIIISIVPVSDASFGEALGNVFALIGAIYLSQKTYKYFKDK